MAKCVTPIIAHAFTLVLLYLCTLYKNIEIRILFELISWSDMNHGSYMSGQDQKRLKTWQWFCLSQSYSHLTYLCLSSVRASKRSLYIFLAFSPSTSHIFSQDLTLKKNISVNIINIEFFLQLFYLKFTHFWRKIHVQEKKNETRSLSSWFPAYLYHFPGNLKF